MSRKVTFEIDDDLCRLLEEDGKETEELAKADGEFIKFDLDTMIDLKVVQPVSEIIEHLKKDLLLRRLNI